METRTLTEAYKEILKLRDIDKAITESVQRELNKRDNDHLVHPLMKAIFDR